MQALRWVCAKSVLAGNCRKVFNTMLKQTPVLPENDAAAACCTGLILR